MENIHATRTLEDGTFQECYIEPFITVDDELVPMTQEQYDAKIVELEADGWEVL